jgi:hypothetical protein
MTNEDRFVPKGFSPSDDQEDEGNVILQNLVRRNPKVKLRLGGNDKTPNRDGFIELRAEKHVIGKLEIQVRPVDSERKKQNRLCYQLDASLIGHSLVAGLPFILVCYDRESDKAYWKHIMEALFDGAKPDQQTKTVEFVAEDEIGDGLSYTDSWLQLVREHLEKLKGNLPNEMNDLKIALLKDVDEPDRQALQEFIGLINSEFDLHWAQIKEQFFPALWKFGVLLIQRHAEFNAWVFQVYSVRKGGNAPLVMAGPELDPRETAADAFGRNAFSTCFTRMFNPVKDAAGFVHSIVSEAVKAHLFEPDSEACQTEHAWAAYRAFPTLEKSVKKETLQIELLLEELSTLDLNELGIPEYYFHDAQIACDNGIVACQRLLALGKDNVKNLYVGNECPIAMYEGQTQTNLLKNLETVLKQLLPEYQRFLKSNGLSFLGEQWFDQSLAVVFVIKPRPEGRVTYDYYFVDYDGDGPRIRIVSESSVDAKDMFLTKEVTIEGKKVAVHSMQHRMAPTQIFSYTPLRDVLLEMLTEDIEEYFKAIEKKGRKSQPSSII